MGWRAIAAAGSGLALAAVAFVWLVLVPSQVVHVVRIAVTTTPAAFGLAYEDVAFTAPGGGPRISAWWMAAKHPRGVVIFVHGGNGNRRELYFGGLEMQRFLVGAGFTVLAPDLRNHGRSGSAKDGKITMGVDESRDVRDAIAFAVRRTPGLPVYLLGESMGGAASIFAAADDARVAGLILIDPMLDTGTTELGALYANLGWPKILLGAVRWSADTFFAPDVARRDPLATAKALKRPILLIQDARDPVCRAEFAHALAAANPRVRLWISQDPDSAVAANRWGPHTGAFKLHPDKVEHLILNFTGDIR